MAVTSYFKISERGSTISREVIGGISTFMALSYILFVQPTVLSQCPTGPMDKGAVMFATCVCSALACVVMGLWANLPIALAPAMGHNFFFVFTVCGLAGKGFGLTWPEALAANFIAGILFLAISALGLRRAIMNAIPDSLKFAIAVGIGLLIALIGLEWAGIVVDSPATYIKLGNLKSPVTLLSLFGVAVIGILMDLHFRGAILAGMLITAAAGYLATNMWGADWGYELTGKVAFGDFPQVSATAGKVFGGFGLLFNHKLTQVFLVIFTFLLLDVFDTVGTLVGLGERSGLMKNGQLPNARQAMMADAIGTLSGTVMGTSTITSYIESSAGIAAGARTGLATLVTAALFIISIFAYPFLNCIGAVVPIPASQLGAFSGAETIFCYPVIAPVLIIIGCYMLPVVGRIKWEDFSEALPAFLTIVIMQLSMSITDGIAWGFITYTILKIFTGKPKQCPPIVFFCSVLFVLYYAYGR